MSGFRRRRRLLMSIASARELARAARLLQAAAGRGEDVVLLVESWDFELDAWLRANRWGEPARLAVTR